MTKIFLLPPHLKDLLRQNIYGQALENSEWMEKSLVTSLLDSNKDHKFVENITNKINSESQQIEYIEDIVKVLTKVFKKTKLPSHLKVWIAKVSKDAKRLHGRLSRGPQRDSNKGFDIDWSKENLPSRMARPSTMMRNQLKDSGQYNEKLKLAIDALDEQNICGPKGSVDFLSLLNELTIAANKLEKLSSFEFYDRPGKFLLFLKLDKTLFLDVRRRAIEELGKVNEHFLKETSDTLTALILSRVLDVKITNQDVYRCRTQIKVS